jgi:hypothetical protein
MVRLNYFHHMLSWNLTENRKFFSGIFLQDLRLNDVDGRGKTEGSTDF